MGTLVWLAARHLHIDPGWLLQGIVAALVLCAWKGVLDRLGHLDGEALLESLDRAGW